MKIVKLIGLASAVLFAAPAPAQTAKDVVVSPRPTMEQWNRAMVRNLEDHLHYPVNMIGPRTEGITRVKFHCSDTGVPSSVSIMQTSGDWMLDQAALKAVRKMSTMHPLPDGIGHDQGYAAVVVFAMSDESRDRFVRKLAHDRQMAGTSSRPGGGTSAMLTLLPPDAM